MDVNQFAEFGAAVIRSLPRDIDPNVVQGWIENQRGLEGVLRNALMPVTEAVSRIWKKVELGLQKNAAGYEATLDKGFKIDDYARKILQKTEVSQTEVEVDLVVVTPADLGLTQGGTYEQICGRATEQGLEKCQREVGPALRLAYKDQPKGEWLRVAMDPEADPGGSLVVFRVEHDGGGQWLHAGWFHPQDVFRPGARFVFVRPRK